MFWTTSSWNITICIINSNLCLICYHCFQNSFFWELYVYFYCGFSTACCFTWYASSREIFTLSIYFSIWERRIIMWRQVEYIQWVTTDSCFLCKKLQHDKSSTWLCIIVLMDPGIPVPLVWTLYYYLLSLRQHNKILNWKEGHENQDGWTACGCLTSIKGTDQDRLILLLTWQAFLLEVKIGSFTRMIAV